MKTLAMRASLCRGIRFQPGVGDRAAALRTDAVQPLLHPFSGSVDIGQFGKFHIGERVRHIGFVAIVGIIRHAEPGAPPDGFFLRIETFPEVLQLLFGKIGHLLLPHYGMYAIRIMLPCQCVSVSTSASMFMGFFLISITKSDYADDVTRDVDVHQMYGSRRHCPLSFSSGAGRLSRLRGSPLILIKVIPDRRRILQIKPFSIEGYMFKKILVPTDGSDLSNRAVRAAIEFAGEHDSAIVGLSVAQILPHASFTMVSRRNDFTLLSESIHQQAKDYARIIEDLAATACVACQVHTVDNEKPWKAIIEAVSQYACDSIFMASHGRSGLNSILLGSQTQKVLIHSDVPVIIYK